MIGIINNYELIINGVFVQDSPFTIRSFHLLLPALWQQIAISSRRSFRIAKSMDLFFLPVKFMMGWLPFMTTGNGVVS